MNISKSNVVAVSVAAVGSKVGSSIDDSVPVVVRDVWKCGCDEAALFFSDGCLSGDNIVAFGGSGAGMVGVRVFVDGVRHAGVVGVVPLWMTDVMVE